MLRRISIIIIVLTLAFVFSVPAMDTVAFATDGDKKKPTIKYTRASIKFVKKRGKNLDIRKQAGKKLKGYTVLQGACSDGRYIYMAFEKRNGDPDGKDRARIKIAKVRIKGWKLVKVSKSGLKLGHANDMTYNMHKKYLVVTGAKVNDPYVSLVDPGTLMKIGTKRVRLGKKYKYAKAFNAIDYDNKSRTYFVRGRETDGMSFIVDQDFRFISASNIKSIWPNRHVQSSASRGEFFIVPQSMNQSKNKNTITFFSKTGGAVRSIRIPVTGELQSLFYVGNRMYGAVYRKAGKSRKAFLIRIRLK